MAHFKKTLLLHEGGRRACTQRNRPSQAISKCVQWQWMGGVGSDEERFACIEYPTACTFARPRYPDLFLRRFLKRRFYKNRPHKIQEPKRAVGDECSTSNQDLLGFWQFCESLNATNYKCRRTSSRTFPTWDRSK
jgi:hypothetical protein